MRTLVFSTPEVAEQRPEEVSSPGETTEIQEYFSGRDADLRGPGPLLVSCHWERSKTPPGKLPLGEVQDPSWSVAPRRGPEPLLLSCPWERSRTPPGQLPPRDVYARPLTEQGPPEHCSLKRTRLLCLCRLPHCGLHAATSARAAACIWLGS